MINISKERYLELLNSENILNALRDGGVDNWEGYGDSLPKMEITEEMIKPGIIVEDEK